MGSQFIVRVTPRAAREKVERTDSLIKMWLTQPPVDNQANDRARRLLAELLDVPLRAVHLIRGQGSRTKVFNIDD